MRMNDAVQKLQVLVVDDSPVSRKLLEHALSAEPYALLFAKNGEEALRLFSENKPALVITDWMLPDLSGPELCERIRTDGRSSYTYIILLTSMTEKDSVVEGLAAGADDYLTKPFDSSELRARIGVGRRIIDLHREIDAKNKLLMEMANTDPLTGCQTGARSKNGPGANCGARRVTDFLLGCAYRCRLFQGHQRRLWPRCW